MGDVVLDKMSINDYNSYISNAVENYTQELLKSSRFLSLEESRDFAIWEYNDIFKEGFNTINTYLYNILVSDEKVGIVWVLKENDEGFIGDFLIYEKYRNRGYGYEALRKLERTIEYFGVQKLKLGVFKHNPNALKLYKKVGYSIFREREFDYTMIKEL
ncbi:GNAT family N-acetyltransferase [Paraclostridium bifermentans]|uniref:GNAT family N-acetyltransferase n=1 Tax=Paraclostridium TaxID=1849822 RepID=UPI0021E08BE8|nr:GNAT family N-acetyltransferase [Paraclostridium sp. AKS81]MCU9812585.1 GNAT family N-acetyltransferase [Paraclostridium sp. AKS81]